MRWGRTSVLPQADLKNQINPLKDRFFINFENYGPFRPFIRIDFLFCLYLVFK